MNAAGAEGGSYRLVDRMPARIDPLLTLLHDYFTGFLRDHGRILRRSEIDPLAFYQALAKVWIHERTDRGEFTCRLAGEDIRGIYERNMIGLPLRALVDPPKADEVLAYHEAVLMTPGIGYITGRIYLHSKNRYGIGERLLLPACGADGAIRFIWGATCYNLVDRENDNVAEGLNRIIVPLSSLSAGPF